MSLKLTRSGAGSRKDAITLLVRPFAFRRKTLEKKLPCLVQCYLPHIGSCQSATELLAASPAK